MKVGLSWHWDLRLTSAYLTQSIPNVMQASGIRVLSNRVQCLGQMTLRCLGLVTLRCRIEYCLSGLGLALHRKFEAHEGSDLTLETWEFGLVVSSWPLNLERVTSAGTTRSLRMKCGWPWIKTPIHLIPSTGARDWRARNLGLVGVFSDWMTLVGLVALIVNWKSQVYNVI